MHVFSLAWTIVAVALTAIVNAAPYHQRLPYTIKEVYSVPPQWSKVGVPSPDTMVKLTVGLKIKSFRELENHLLDLTSTSHPRYGRPINKEKVHDLLTPESDSIALVEAWLDDWGIGPEQREYNALRNRITFSLPLFRVEKLLKTQYSIFQHESGETLIRAPSWSLPGQLHAHIMSVQPTTAFFSSPVTDSKK